MAGQRLVLLSRATAIALRALVELAREPVKTLSVAELAARQQLPQPMLEQILLRLRREGLVVARRGRHGGYRLALAAEALPLARVLRAVEAPRGSPPEPSASGDPLLPQDRLSVDQLPVEPHLEGLPVDRWQRSAAAAIGQGSAGEPVASLGASAGHRVEQQLRRRLERLLQQELQRLTLAELLYDQRSWEASLGPDGGVMLS